LFLPILASCRRRSNTIDPVVTSWLAKRPQSAVTSTVFNNLDIATVVDRYLDNPI
jgi:hypothetical protein